MSRAEKDSGPSMEEILASIRKIISEEPPGAKAVSAAPELRRQPQGSVANSASSASTSAVGFSAPVSHAVPAASASPARQAIDSGSQVSAPRISAAVAHPAPIDSAPSAGSIAAAVNTPPAASVTRSKEDQNALNHLLLEEDLADLVDAAPIVTPQAATGRSAAYGAAGQPAVAPHAGTVKAGWQFPRPGLKPQAPASERQPSADKATANVAEALAAALGKANGAAAGPHLSHADAVSLDDVPAARPTMPVPPNARGPAPPPPVATAAAAGLEASLAAAKEAAIKAAARDAAARETANRSLASPLDALAAGLAPSSAPAMADSHPAIPVASAVSDGPVLPPVPAPTAEVVVVASVAPSAVATAPIAAPVAVVGAKIEAPSAQVTVAEAGSAAVPVRTMEDTVAELLRPMLRDWLDTNMPRIVEKALRVEMANVVKPGSKPPSA